MASGIMEKKVLDGRRNECWTETGTAGRINVIGHEKRQVEIAWESNAYSLALAGLSRMKKYKTDLKGKSKHSKTESTFWAP